MKQSDNFKNILTKHGYIGDLACFLEKIYDALIHFLGPSYENIIYKALLNVPILDYEQNYEYIKNNYLFDDSYEIYLNRASGAYLSRPIISYNPQTNIYKFERAQRVIVINESSNLNVWIYYCFVDFSTQMS